MPLSISIVIPAHNAGRHLGDCLRSVAQSSVLPSETIVVDDASTDDTLGCAAAFNVRVIASAGRGGPAQARNRGALSAGGDILLFLDADVTLHPDAIERARAILEAHPELDAVFGSYDDNPEAPGFVSQFRNLLHCFVHQTGRRQASTFWAGCGAIRRDVFLRNSGFDVAYSIPSIEDIEFGARLTDRGGHIELRPEIQVKHAKRWTLSNMIETDIWRRGVPWTRLVLSSGRMPDTLSLNHRNRASVLLSGFTLLSAIAGVVSQIATQRFSWIFWFAAAASLALLILLNRDFCRFLASRRGVWFALRAIPLHLLFFLCCGISFAIGLAQHSIALLRGMQPVARLSK